MRFAIVQSSFNDEITAGLLQGATGYLREQGIEFDEADLFSSPGAFEIPLLAQKIADSGKFDGVICLGCVIKGDTAHFEFISLGATIGLMEGMLKTGVPMSFGILTTYTDAQAEARSSKDPHNKGREAAAACLSAAQTLARIAKLK